MKCTMMTEDGSTYTCSDPQCPEHGERNQAFKFPKPLSHKPHVALSEMQELVEDLQKKNFAYLHQVCEFQGRVRRSQVTGMRMEMEPWIVGATQLQMISLTQEKELLQLLKS